MTRSRLPVQSYAVALVVVFVGFFLAARSGSSQQPRPVDSPESASDVTRVTMRGLFTAFSNVYYYSLNMDYFSDRRNHDTVTAALEALVANAAEFRDHGGGLDPSFGYLRGTVASDAREALKRYNEREYLGSQFMLNKLMENCAMCHSRIETDQAFDLGAGFLKKVRADALAPVDRVSVEIAARQFDAALATYERILASPRIPAEGLVLMGAFDGYLRICIGVRNDTERPIRTFETFVKQRNDVPSELRQQAESWIRDLRALDLSKASGRELDVARELVRDAAVSNRPARDRSDLVRMVAANAFLRRHVRSLSSYDDETAEVYYLLAVTESRASRSYRIAEVDFLLEQAVRSAPRTDYARRAFAVLEERSKTPPPATAYEGQQVHTVNIEELRKLVEG